ncbi:glycosyltransferase involved in cell wall biosynthesis [Catalinimonas alkaloidigena]|uniref:glycosyltransferase n=1 Tax=Catalinimonas alkaloidigena TaxID=1075417 RepID=UPI002405D73D|nr:glycosyltransferase [Catalinimonas alkaloidigena]MDF9801095.1 glycosyltransferase involved in cell wall biosynthesis [Catalinimonas alkaloidigena]
MTIAFICHDAGAYGAPRSLLDLIDGFKDRNIKCYVIIPYAGPLIKELQKRNIKYKVIPYVLWVHKEIPNLWIEIKSIIKNFPHNRLHKAIQNFIAIPQIIAQIKEWQADIIYTNSSVTPVGAIAAYIVRKPHVWHIREFQKLDQALVLDWGKGIMRRVAKKSGAIIFISKAIQDYYQKFLSNSNCHVVYNGVASSEEFDRFKMQKSSFTKRKDGEFTFCIVGRIIPQKGQHEAIKAISILIERGWKVRLIVAGSGNQTRLAKLVNDLGIEKYIDIIGRTSTPYSVYFQSDACLMCSIHEAFGRVTVEAMTTGIPVIGKKNKFSGTQELIQHKSTGLLYSGNELELANTMELLLKKPSWGVQLGINGWRYAKGHFNREIYIDNIYKILRNIADS